MSRSKVIGRIAIILGLIVAGLLILGLSMCQGPYLGSYQFDHARLVNSTALAAIEPAHPATDANSSMIRIEFTSDQDMRAAAGDSQLYVHADFCPGHDEYRLLMIGPYYNDRSRYSSNRADAVPTRDPRTNRFVYTAYIVPSQPATQFGGPYDLRSEVSDLCLWIDHPGYYLTRSQSDVFTIPGAAIAAALQRRPAPR